MTLAPAFSRAIVEAEVAGAARWTTRHGVTHTWDPEALLLRANLTKASTADRYLVLGRFDDYRELPPRWTFAALDGTGEGVPRNYPRVRRPKRAALCMLYQGRPVICAPFNRLAYQELQGPHSDWGGPAGWLSVNTGSICATHVADMLAALQVEVDASDGRLGDPE